MIRLRSVNYMHFAFKAWSLNYFIPPVSLDFSYFSLDFLVLGRFSEIEGGNKNKFV